MATEIRPKLSIKNKYYISKERYYELKHFCLQYIEWSKELNSMRIMASPNIDIRVMTSHEDYISEIAMKRAKLNSNIDMLREVAEETDTFLADYILKAITEGRTYEYMKLNYDIPCGRDMFYDRYRRFFWLLDKIR